MKNELGMTSMIDLKAKTMTLNGETQNIKLFAVWWVGIDGLYTTIDEALQDCVRNNVEPNMLRPVSVAIGTLGHYEVIMR